MITSAASVLLTISPYSVQQTHGHVKEKETLFELCKMDQKTGTQHGQQQSSGRQFNLQCSIVRAGMESHWTRQCFASPALPGFDSCVYCSLSFLILVDKSVVFYRHCLSVYSVECSKTAICLPYLRGLFELLPFSHLEQACLFFSHL